jgi:hypothetical protein
MIVEVVGQSGGYAGQSGFMPVKLNSNYELSVIFLYLFAYLKSISELLTC